jgi:acetyl esterase/lipase
MSPHAFLTTAAVGALNTFNAKRPLARLGPVSVPSFFAGWLTSELAPQSIAVHAVTTAAFARRGALGSPAGKLGLALSAGSVAALTSIAHQASQADGVLEAALVEALGQPHGGELAHMDPPVGLTDALLPFPAVRRRYVAEKDISYGPNGKRNLLDVWHRDDLPADATAPVLLQVHGGAWVSGNKEQQGAPLMSYLAEKGWVCVAVNYRLSPKAKWPDHIVDVKRALAWIRSNIGRYGGDPNFVAITGGSAGGHLCSLAALTPNDPAFQPGFEEVDTTVQAAVPFYGVYDFINRDGTGRDDLQGFLHRMVMANDEADAPEVWSAASPMSHVGDHAPPFFIMHGDNDALVPVEQARSFASMLRSSSTAPVVYAELPGAQHAFDVFSSVRARHSSRAVGRFLNHVRLNADQPNLRA